MTTKWAVKIELERRDDCKIKLKFKLGQVSVSFMQGTTLQMGLTLPVDSEVPFVLPGEGLDSRGNKVTLKTPPTCRVSDEAVLRVVQPDPATPDNVLSGVLQAVGPVGSGQFIIEDMDDGTQPLMAIVDVVTVPGDVVALGLPTFGDVRKQV